MSHENKPKQSNRNVLMVIFRFKQYVFNRSSTLIFGEVGIRCLTFLLLAERLPCEITHKSPAARGLRI